jgi:6-phosphofructokinase 1
MGHKVGWLTLNAGMAGGADIILIPEIPYSIDSVIKKVTERAAQGHGFTILAVAEGAISVEDSKLTKKEYKKRLAEMQKTYPSVSYEIANKITEATGKEVRVTVPGHMQRGGAPCPYDRVLSSRLGATAALMISKGEYGNMVAIQNRAIVSVPLSEVAGKLKMVDPESDIIAEARLLGISFGDD